MAFLIGIGCYACRGVTAVFAHCTGSKTTLHSVRDGKLRHCRWSSRDGGNVALVFALSVSHIGLVLAVH